jgi:hypothetical protein
VTREDSNLGTSPNVPMQCLWDPLLYRLVVVNKLGADIKRFLFSMPSVTQSERDSILHIPIYSRGGLAQLQVLDYWQYVHRFPPTNSSVLFP